MKRPGFNIDEAWSIAARSSWSVVNLAQGGYAVPVERGPIAPPDPHVPIRAHVPYGIALIIPGPMALWVVVGLDHPAPVGAVS